MESVYRVMRGPKDHPCFGCEHFQGYENVKSMDTHGRGFEWDIDIPVCGYITYTFALGRCEKFEEDDLMKEMKNAGTKN
jgi:hypothetical protein